MTSNDRSGLVSIHGRLDQSHCDRIQIIGLKEVVKQKQKYI